MADENSNAMPVHPRTGLAAIGVVGGKPVWAVLGGSGESDPDGGQPVVDPVVDPEPIETDPEPGATDPDEWTPPTREEWEAAQKQRADLAAQQKATADQLKRANAESAQRRKELKDLQAKHEDDETKAAREAREAAMAQVKPVAIRAEATSSLLAAQAKPERTSALLRLLDMAAIDLDVDSGQITGLDTQIEQIKADYPEFFVDPHPPAPEPPRKPAAPKLDTSGRKPGPAGNEPKTFGETVAALYSRK